MQIKITTLLLLASIAIMAYLILQPHEQKTHTPQEMANISKAFGEKFADAERKRAANTSKQTKPKNHPTTSQAAVSTSDQQILGVIYKKPETTWFFKAKDSRAKIETASASFKNYFVDQLKFDNNHQPDFSHIPDSMKTENKSSMRVATFLIGDVEISVSQLAGQQDVFANVQRWMRQVGLNDNSKVQLDFKDNNKTIIVRLPK